MSFNKAAQAFAAGLAVAATPLAGAVAQAPPRFPAPPQVDAPTLYAACFLLAHGADVPRPAPDRIYPFGAVSCGLHAVHAVALWEGRPAGGFCLDLPKDAPDAAIQMAKAFVEYEDRNPYTGPPPAGETRFRAALAERWPC